MLENYYVFHLYNNKLALDKHDHSGVTTTTIFLETNSIGYAQEYTKEMGCLLLGPRLSGVKNRLRLIKYYDKTENQTRIRVYRNLHKNCFSFIQGGLVVGYSKYVTRFIRNCKSIIRQSGRDKALRTGVRNVHAFIEGDIVDVPLYFNWDWTQIQYSLQDGFVCEGKPVDFIGKTVKIDMNKIYISS